MSPELISIAVLVAIFIIASFLPLNLGVLAFAASYIVGSLVAGLAPDDIVAGFPASLFVLLVGLTYLFAIAQSNGTVQRITDAGVQLVRGRVALLPWLMYALATLLAAMGALAAASLAIVAPIALRFSARYSINPLLMGIMACLGSTGGSFSPISPFGAIVNGTLAENDLPQSPGLLFINNVLFSTLVAALVFVVLGGVGLWRRGKIDVTGSEGQPDDAVASSAQSDETGSRAAQAATMGGIVILVLGALVFDLDVGLLAFVIAVPLALFATANPAATIKQVPWSVVLLISGMLTYVGVLEEMGTLEYVGELIAGGDNPLLTALATIYIAGIVSAFAATAGVLAATIPLAVPLLQVTDLSIIGIVTAITIASTIVDSSPTSTNGALLLANQQQMEERRYFRGLLTWAVLTVVVGPPIAWLIFVVIGG